jgi:hypothetical protein
VPFPEIHRKLIMNSSVHATGTHWSLKLIHDYNKLQAVMEMDAGVYSISVPNSGRIYSSTPYSEF